MKSEKRRFLNCRFQAETVKEAIQAFDRETKGENATRMSLSAMIDGTERGHDDETEFFADYRKDPDNITYRRAVIGEHSAVLAEMKLLTFRGLAAHLVVTVEVEADQWPQILAVMEVFEAHRSQAELPEPKAEPPIIFLGHGQSASWKELRDHLQDKHGLKIEAYEIGARAGHTIRDILQSMLQKSSMAFLVGRRFYGLRTSASSPQCRPRSRVISGPVRIQSRNYFATRRNNRILEYPWS